MSLNLLDDIGIFAERPQASKQSPLNLEDDLGVFDDKAEFKSISDYIRSNEGTEEQEYIDTSGNKTIGVGHQLKKGEKVTDIEDTFGKDVREKISITKNLFPKYAEYPLEVKQALVDGVFRGEHKKGYKTTKYINDGEWGKVPDEYINRKDYRDSKASEGTEKPITGIYKRIDRNAERFRNYAATQSTRPQATSGTDIASQLEDDLGIFKQPPAPTEQQVGTFRGALKIGQDFMTAIRRPFIPELPGEKKLLEASKQAIDNIPPEDLAKIQTATGLAIPGVREWTAFNLLKNAGISLSKGEQLTLNSLITTRSIFEKFPQAVKPTAKIIGKGISTGLGIGASLLPAFPKKGEITKSLQDKILSLDDDTLAAVGETVGDIALFSLIRGVSDVVTRKQAINRYQKIRTEQEDKITQLNLSKDQQIERLLGVSKDATPEQVKSAYRAKSIFWHPDKETGNKDIFNKIQAAYQVKMREFGINAGNLGISEMYGGGPSTRQIIEAIKGLKLDPQETQTLIKGATKGGLKALPMAIQEKIGNMLAPAPQAPPQPAEVAKTPIVEAPDLLSQAKQAIAEGKTAEEWVEIQFNKKADYGMAHRPSWEDMPPAHNLLEGEAIPKDVYEHPEFSIASGRNIKTDKAAKESWEVLQKIRGNPEQEVTVYRATRKKELNIGDWVTFSKEYASQSVEAPEKVYSFKVKAKDVIFAGDDINEFGYYPKSQLLSLYEQAKGEGRPETMPPAIPPKAVVPPIEPPISPITEGAAQPKEDPVVILQKALKESKPLSDKQKSLISQEKRQRVAKATAMAKTMQGQKGFFAEIGSLKGKYEKVQFESLKGKISQDDIDSLFNQIATHPDLTYFDTINARNGLGKLFGEFGGGIPTSTEIDLLTTVFGKDLTDLLLQKKTWLEKLGRTALDVLNVPRSMMASFDFSAPFRQGIFLVTRPEFYSSFAKMFPQTFSQNYFDQLQKSIKTSPYYELAQESGLSLTGLGSELSQREEVYMSNLAEKIPGVGIGIKSSERAYIGFLNKLRFDCFQNLSKAAQAQGYDIDENEKVFKNIADFVNNATGRGRLPQSMQNSATALNAIFFSPRLHIARFRLLNPIYYAKLDPFTRKQALKSLFGFAGFVFTMLTLAKMSGAKVGTDPRSTDFGKIKIGNLRLDITGGFQQIAVLLARLATNQMVSSSTGKLYTLGEGYKPTTRLDVISRYLTYKTAPVVSFMLDLLRGKTSIGEPFTMGKAIKDRLTPLVLQDTIDIAKEEPGLLPFTIPALFGVGIQYYKNAKETDFVKQIEAKYKTSNASDFVKQIEAKYKR